MKFELTKPVDWGKIRINLDEFNEIFINIQDITVNHWDTTWKKNKPLGKVYLFDDYKLIFSSWFYGNIPIDLNVNLSLFSSGLLIFDLKNVNNNKLPEFVEISLDYF